MSGRRINPALVEDYCYWLTNQLRKTRTTETYKDLSHILFFTEFTSRIPMDDNRMADGMDLRTEFCYERGFVPTKLQSLGPCSFLEMLVGLSRRLAFVAGGDPSEWAWQLLGNLKLQKLSDPLSEREARKVHRILETVNQRKYEPDGTGGFFPLAWPEEDQREIELWYQLNAYAEETHPGN